MKGRDCRQAGFTLIELLVTITIVVLITGVSIAAYITFNETRQLDVDARSLLSSVSRVRSRSLFLEYPDDCTGLINFTLESATGVSGALDSIYSFANCSEGVRGEEMVKILNSTSFSAPFEIAFLPLTGNIATGQDVAIVLETLKGTPRSKTVTVNHLINSSNTISDN